MNGPLTFFEWIQLLSSCGILTGGGALFSYVLRTDRRITALETTLSFHMKDHK